MNDEKTKSRVKLKTHWFTCIVLVFFVLIGLVLWLNADKLHIYQTYFTKTSPQVQMRFSELSFNMDERAIREHFKGVPLDCIDQSQQRNGLGDRVCYTSIDSADGQSALTLALFSSGGHLRHAMVQLPWWAHSQTMQHLVHQRGRGSRNGRVQGSFRGPVLRWELDNGHLTMNRDRQLLLLEWSVILWTAVEVER